MFDNNVNKTNGPEKQIEKVVDKMGWSVAYVVISLI